MLSTKCIYADRVLAVALYNCMLSMCDRYRIPTYVPIIVRILTTSVYLVFLLFYFCSFAYSSRIAYLIYRVNQRIKESIRWNVKLWYFAILPQWSGKRVFIIIWFGGGKSCLWISPYKQRAIRPLRKSNSTSLKCLRIFSGYVSVFSMVYSFNWHSCFSL